MKTISKLNRIKKAVKQAESNLKPSRLVRVYFIQYLRALNAIKKTGK